MIWFRDTDGVQAMIAKAEGADIVHGKVLLLSQRRISDLVAFCLAYEFEDTLQAVTTPNGSMPPISPLPRVLPSAPTS